MTHKRYTSTSSAVVQASLREYTEKGRFARIDIAADRYPQLNNVSRSVTDLKACSAKVGQIQQHITHPSDHDS